MTHFTLHIFGYGETQVNGDEFSVKVKTSTLTKVKPLADAIWALKPTDNDAEQEFHAINVFNFKEIRYVSRKGFKVEVSDELKTLVENLLAELKVAFDALPPKP
jgi:hypothetical protein